MSTARSGRVKPQGGASSSMAVHLVIRRSQDSRRPLVRRATRAVVVPRQRACSLLRWRFRHGEMDVRRRFDRHCRAVAHGDDAAELLRAQHFPHRVVRQSNAAVVGAAVGVACAEARVGRRWRSGVPGGAGDGRPVGGLEPHSPCPAGRRHRTSLTGSRRRSDLWLRSFRGPFGRRPLWVIFPNMKVKTTHV